MLGAGTSTSDSIPAYLSNGEYVIKAASVAKAGVATLDAINQTGQVPAAVVGGGSPRRDPAPRVVFMSPQGKPLTHERVVALKDEPAILFVEMINEPVHHPEDLFDEPPEAAVIDPENPYVRDPHLRCAAREVPLRVTPESATVWRFPIETVAKSEKGLDRTVQGVSVTPARALNSPADSVVGTAI